MLAQRHPPRLHASKPNSAHLTCGSGRLARLLLTLPLILILPLTAEKERVERTLLSAAFCLAPDFDLASTRAAIAPRKSGGRRFI